MTTRTQRMTFHARDIAPKRLALMSRMLLVLPILLVLLSATQAMAQTSTPPTYKPTVSIGSTRQPVAAGGIHLTSQQTLSSYGTGSTWSSSWGGPTMNIRMSHSSARGISRVSSHAAPTISFSSPNIGWKSSRSYILPISEAELNDNGIATAPGMRKERGDGGNRGNGGGNAGTPGGGTQNEDRLPIGDSLLPLLLLAVAYFLYRYRELAA